MSTTTASANCNNGKINEVDRKRMLQYDKSSGFDPIHNRSHLFHAIEGLHRYPNYLQRFQNVEEIDSLEAALEQQLDKVRSQRASIIRKKAEKTASPLLDPSWKRTPSTWDDVELILHKDIARYLLPQCRKHALPDVLQGKVDLEYTVPSLAKLMSEETIPEVFSLPILDSYFCQKLHQYASSVMPEHDEKTRTQAVVNLDGVLLELAWLNDLIFHIILRPIARHLHSGLELDWRHGYLARYRPEQRSHLVKHTDDAEVTLNIGINDAYEGGNVRFGEFRGEAAANLREEDNDYQHKVGKGILHSGRHFHAVTPVTSGERWVWIMWTRSWSGERSTRCPCCWLNNRSTKEPCICGPAWN